MTAEGRPTLEHLFSCFDSAYRALGELAPTLSRDAYVVRAYEAARSMGEVALSLRERLGEVRPDPVEPLEAVLREAARAEDGGALLLYCFATLVGPRLLVSLRDARELARLEGEDRAVASRASAVLIGEVRAVGAALAGEALVEDPAFVERARGLARRLEAAGNAESFGFGREVAHPRITRGSEGDSAPSKGSHGERPD